MFKYSSGWAEGDRFIIVSNENRTYNTHIYIDVGETGTVMDPFKKDFPEDAVQVELDSGGMGALDVHMLGRIS